MTASQKTSSGTFVLDDPAVPGDHLLGGGARDVIAAALAEVGAEVERTSPTGTAYQRGRSLTVSHDVVVRWDDGRRSTEQLVLHGGRRTPPDGALVMSDGDHDIVVWRVPADPWLPGLAPALDPTRIAPLLARLGFPADALQTRLRAYRPGRRAVVEVWGPGTRAFLKVVRPDRAEALHQRHTALDDVAEVPASLGWSAEHGIVVLQALPGRTVRQVLAGSGPLPSGAELLAVLDSLPPTDDAPHKGWRLEEFRDHIATVHPAVADAVADLAAGLAPFESEVAAGPAVPVHGDLYEAQVIVDGGRVVGLLDIDTFGSGRRIDDLATYVGHLVVLATTMPGREARILGHARDVLAAFDATVDPPALRAAVAAVILGLATGSFRVLDEDWPAHTDHRIRLAHEWLASARSVRAESAPTPEKDLMSTSRVAHGPPST